MRLPTTLTDQFIENEHHFYQNRKTATNITKKPVNIPINISNSYIVEKGDNLNKIAAKHKITLTQLKTWNGLQTNYLIKDQRLVIKNKN